MGGLTTGEDFRIWHTESSDLNRDNKANADDKDEDDDEELSN
jgi:hypothetical protein